MDFNQVFGLKYVGHLSSDASKFSDCAILDDNLVRVKSTSPRQNVKGPIAFLYASTIYIGLTSCQWCAK